MNEQEANKQSVLGEMTPNKAIVKLAVPATLALLAKAVYNLVDTAYIGMLNNDLAMAGVGVSVIIGAALCVGGIVQRLVLIDCYIVMGFMQGYQPVASYAFGAKEVDRFHQPAADILTILVCLLSVKSMKASASRNMGAVQGG